LSKFPVLAEKEETNREELTRQRERSKMDLQACLDLSRDLEYFRKAKRAKAEVPRKRKSLGQKIAERAYEEMELADFALVFEGEEVACHKVILAGASPVLSAMVRNLDEAVEGKSVIQLPAAIGRAFVRYIYLEVVDEDHLKEEAVVFLELGEKYEMDELKELAEDTMLKILDMRNAIKFLLAGDMFRAERIKAAAKRLVKSDPAWLRGEGRGELMELDKALLVELI